MEGIRSDVRTLRTDLGLDLESEKKKDGKETDDEKKRKKLNSDVKMENAMSIMTVKNSIMRTTYPGTTTVGDYYCGKVSSNEDCFTSDKNVDKVDIESDGSSGDKSECKKCKSNSRIDVSAAHAVLPHTNITHPSPTATLTEGDLDLNLESVKGWEPCSIDGLDSLGSMEGVDGLDVTMYTPSILLLVDEIAALEKDILKRHTDITAAQVI